MADKNTGWACTCNIELLEATDAYDKIRVICHWQNQGWRYNINFVSGWVYCNGQEVQVMSNGSVNNQSSNQASYLIGWADFTIYRNTSIQNISCYTKITSNSSYVQGTKTSSSQNWGVGSKPSYTVSYNANGGSGAPGNQIKWYNDNLVLSSTRPSRTGHNFVRWNTNTSNTGTAYTPGATYTGNAGLTLYAIWSAYTHTIIYNANGGSGAPGNQTKTYGVPLYISSTIPTKTNYNFLGWATSSDGSVVYKAGDNYPPDYDGGTITLYAVWQLAYKKPRISNVSINRCTSNGTISDSGTYLKYSFKWATDKAVTSIWLDWSTNSNFSTYSNAQVTASGTSGTVSQVVGGGGVNNETSYFARIYVSDSLDWSHSPTLSIGTIKFPIDVKAGGKGVAFGKTAELDNTFDVGYSAKFRKIIEVFDEITKNGGYYKGFRGWASDANTALTHGYYNTNSSTANLPGTNKYGSLEVIESRGQTWVYSNTDSWIWQIFRNTNGQEYRRYGVNSSTMSDWALK